MNDRTGVMRRTQPLIMNLHPEGETGSEKEMPMPSGPRPGFKMD